MCCVIYIFNTQPTLNKFKGGHLFKTDRKLYSFVSHYEPHFKSTMTYTNLYTYILFKLVKHTNSNETMNILQNLTVTCVWRNI